MRVKLNQLSHDSTPLHGPSSQLVPCHGLLHCVVLWTETISIDNFSFLANSGSCMVVYNHLGSHITVQSCEQKVEFGVHHSDEHRNKSLGLCMGEYSLYMHLQMYMASYDPLASMLYTGILVVFSCCLHVCTVCLLRIVATVKQ